MSSEAKSESILAKEDMRYEFMWAIVGLGNPGIRYKWNRHNIGYQIIDLISATYNIRLKKDKIMPALAGSGEIDGVKTVLFKPTTYMNRSGIAVKGLQEIYSISPKKILVVVDDLDLPWGKIRIRQYGSSGGHKGIESIITELATTNFPRIRMGIGRPMVSGCEVVEHVLGNFSREERKELDEYCEKVVKAVVAILTSDIEKAMNKFN